MDQSKKIFVSVANYRDSETPHTVREMMLMAKYPERIYVGVHSQVDKVEDAHCLAPAHPNVKQIFTHFSESKGCGWARARIMDELLGDEDFFFQIDSHTRFAQDWDVKAIEEWNACKDPMAYITHYPPGYSLDGSRSEDKYIYHIVKRFMFNGLPVLTSAVTDLFMAPPKPARTPWLAAGCFFIPAKAVKVVPYDPYIYFEGEETAMAFRLFSHGWSGYSIRNPFIYHLYFAASNGRKRHFEQNPDYTKLNDTSFARVRHLLGIEPCKNPTYMREYDKYLPGTLRTLQQYEHFSGVYFREQRLTERAQTAQYK